MALGPVKLVLLVLAFVLLLVAAFGISHPRVNTAYLGLAFFILSFIV